MQWVAGVLVMRVGGRMGSVGRERGEKQLGRMARLTDCEAKRNVCEMVTRFSLRTAHAYGSHVLLVRLSRIGINASARHIRPWLARGIAMRCLRVCDACGPTHEFRKPGAAGDTPGPNGEGDALRGPAKRL